MSFSGRPKLVFTHSFQVLLFGLKVQWIKSPDVFLHGEHNAPVCISKFLLFRLNGNVLFSYSIYWLCYWGHTCQVELLHFTFFNSLSKFYFLLTKDLILCISRTWKTLFKTIHSHKLSTERQKWFSFTSLKM